MTWYLEIRLDGDDNTQALQQLKVMLKNPSSGLIRVTVVGYDSNSGNMVHVFKIYTMDKLMYGGRFQDVFVWNGVERTEPNWGNFNKVLPLTEAEQNLVNDLIKDSYTENHRGAQRATENKNNS
jgi:hypothetical protein